MVNDALVKKAMYIALHW